MTVTLDLESENGNINLTAYLNVQKGEGMDPADPQFTNKVFAHSLLKQGGTLALEDLKLRELTFPLRLKSTSKDALTALVREINTIINTSGCIAAWTDEGASQPTYFQLASGQCDPDFDYRQGEHWMLPVKLRLFVQPLGFIEKTPRSLLMAGTSAEHGATLTGTLPVMVFHAASQIRGDGGALIEAVLPTPSQNYFAALSVLPNASYQPFVAASGPEMAGGGIGTGWKASTSPTEGIINIGNAGVSPLSIVRASGAYVGNHRVLVLAKRVVAASDVKIGVQIEASSGQLNAASNSTLAVDVPSPSWSLLDCDVIARASLPAREWAVQLTSTATVAIAGVIMLPENSTVWLREPEESTTKQEQLKISGISDTIAQEGETGVWLEMSGKARGAIPTIPPRVVPPAIALMAFNANTLTTKRSFYVNCLERTRYVF